MKSKMTHSQQSTYDAVFQHPIARNLDWHDVHAMLGAISESSQDPNGNVRFTRNGQTLFLHPAREKDVTDVDELMKIRHFLQNSKTMTEAKAESESLQLLVVLDHRQAKVYRTERRGAVPERIAPYDPHGYDKHLHYVQDDSNGQRKPERRSFYEAIIKTLRGADQILLFGHGSGASSAMETLLSDLKDRHPQLAGCVVGSIVVDDQHLTENQLLAKAREFFSEAGVAKR